MRKASVDDLTVTRTVKQLQITEYWHQTAASKIISQSIFCLFPGLYRRGADMSRKGNVVVSPTTKDEHTCQCAPIPAGKSLRVTLWCHLSKDELTC